jgi:NodT family efflux transporter outer membrane factor (OMF) lipoprotein
MPLMQVSRPLARKSAILAMAAALCLGGCTVGPDYHKPTAVAPADWTSWHSGSDALRPALADAVPLPPDWWQGFRDPVLDELERRAFTASPDLRTAALHFAQARVQRDVTASQGLPQVNATATVQGQRQSEFGASTRLFDEIGGANRDALAKLLGEPYTLYKGGFDASWEIDFWGKVRRSVEAANADIAQQGALLDQARLTLASDVAQAYFSLRSAQRDLAMARADIDDLRERTRILAERTKGGLANHFDLERQHIDLRFAEAQLPALEAQEASQINRIALLLGDRPGSLSDLLHPQESEAAGALPDLALGLPSTVALRRPDIRAAEARLHEATAKIGVARADLYPAIKLGGNFDLESYRASNLFEWGSHSWGIGPSVDLPLFDGARRRRTIRLRELEQKEAAVSFEQTVLRAWQEIDDALNAYQAERVENAKLAERREAARQALDLAQARYGGGIVTWIDVLDARRAYHQARRESWDSDARLGTRYVAVNKAIGNVPGEQAKIASN